MRTTWILLPAALAGSTSGYATVYLTPAQALQALFPGERLQAVEITLTTAQRRAIEKVGGAKVRQPVLRAWRSDRGDWLIIDQVLGKHEFITYAVALSAAGAVRGVEIMEYRETYGGEIRDRQWREQFAGRTVAAPLKLDQDVRNISGATLSCRHVAAGIKRLLATHEIVLKRHA